MKHAMRAAHRIRRTSLGLALAGLLGLTACSDRERLSAGGDARLQSVLRERAEELDPRPLGVGRQLADLAFVDLDGRAGRLADYAGRPLVIAVRDLDCPVSQRSAPALARVEDEYRPRGVAFLIVEASAEEPDAVRADARAQGYEACIVHEADAALLSALGARTSTELFLLDGARTLVYRGALDDQVGRGYTLDAPRRTFLADALDAVLAGRPVACAATNAPGCALALEPAPGAGAPAITYQREVARILQQNCVECHRSGGAAPFALETFEQARAKKGMLALVVDERIMPPWFAADDTGPWRNDRRLTDEERATLLAWVEAGAPEGERADAPLTLVQPEGWTIGPPDLVFELEREAEIPAEGTIDFRYFAADRVVPDDLWIQAMQVLPSDPEVVHHVTMMYQPPRGAEDETRTELRQALLPWSQRPTDGWQFLFPYLPGNGSATLPSGVARFVPKGSRLRFDMHYTPKGVPTRDHTRFGIVLADGPPPFLAEARNLRQLDIAIPPGVADIAFEQHYTFRHDVALQTLTPHMHLRGQGFRVELELQDGTRRELLRLKAWDPGWQFTYAFAEPPLVPAGARLNLRAWYDNSADNPFNPDPTRWVMDGPQVWDEMMSLVIEWVRPRALD